MRPWTDFRLDLDVDDVLRGEGADPGTARTRRPALVEAAGQALEEGLPLIHPSVLVRELAVREIRHERLLLEEGALTGPLIARTLGGASRVTVAVCTIGAGLEERCLSLFASDPLRALALDGLGNSAVNALAEQVCSRIGRQAEAVGLTASPPLSPGSVGWPVEIGQPQIFGLLDPAQAGIRLTSGGMMIPKKSMSFVVGIGAGMEQAADPCDVCGLKESCRYRHA